MLLQYLIKLLFHQAKHYEAFLMYRVILTVLKKLKGEGGERATSWSHMPSRMKQPKLFECRRICSSKPQKKTAECLYWFV